MMLTCAQEYIHVCMHFVPLDGCVICVNTVLCRIIRETIDMRTCMHAYMHAFAHVSLDGESFKSRTPSRHMLLPKNTTDTVGEPGRMGKFSLRGLIILSALVWSGKSVVECRDLAVGQLCCSVQRKDMLLCTHSQSMRLVMCAHI